MDKENKNVKLNDDELENVTGGGTIMKCSANIDKNKELEEIPLPYGVKGVKNEIIARSGD